MRYALILSGGKGVRFWPVSREQNPKQFLAMCSDSPIIEEAIRRVMPLVGVSRTYIAANAMHRKLIEACARRPLRMKRENVFFEPQSKNTLAPIAYLSSMIGRKDPQAVIAVFPADHFVKDNARFRSLIRRGMEIARRGFIVTLGIPPDRPETGYGYIKAGPAGKGFCLIERFVEKPDIARARAFMRDKRYYWNAGIFIFRADVMLEEIRRYCPGVSALLQKHAAGRLDMKRLWQGMPAISVDYAVMEKSRKLALLPAHCGWSDVGSWHSLGELVKKNKDGNVFKGHCIDLESKNSLVWSAHKLVVTVGLEDTVVVDTDDALLVCARDRAQDIKKIVQILKQKKLHKKL